MSNYLNVLGGSTNASDNLEMPSNRKKRKIDRTMIMKKMFGRKREKSIHFSLHQTDLSPDSVHESTENNNKNFSSTKICGIQKKQEKKSNSQKHNLSCKFTSIHENTKCSSSTFHSSVLLHDITCNIEKDTDNSVSATIDTDYCKSCKHVKILSSCSSGVNVPKVFYEEPCAHLKNEVIIVNPIVVVEQLSLKVPALLQCEQHIGNIEQRNNNYKAAKNDCIRASSVEVAKLGCERKPCKQIKMLQSASPNKNCMKLFSPRVQLKSKSAIMEPVINSEKSSVNDKRISHKQPKIKSKSNCRVITKSVQKSQMTSQSSSETSLNTDTSRYTSIVLKPSVDKTQVTTKDVTSVSHCRSDVDTSRLLCCGSKTLDTSQNSGKVNVVKISHLDSKKQTRNDNRIIISSNQLGLGYDKINARLLSNINVKSNLSENEDMKKSIRCNAPASTLQTNNNTSNTSSKNIFIKKTNLGKIVSCENKKPKLTISSLSEEKHKKKTKITISYKDYISRQKILSQTAILSQKTQTAQSSMEYAKCSYSENKLPPPSDILEISVNESLSDYDNSLEKSIQHTESKVVSVSYVPPANEKYKSSKTCGNEQATKYAKESYPTSENDSIHVLNHINPADAVASESELSSGGGDDDDKECSFKRHLSSTDSVISTSNTEQCESESENTLASSTIRSSPVSSYFNSVSSSLSPVSPNVNTESKIGSSLNSLATTQESIPQKVVISETDFLQTIKSCSSAKDLNEIFVIVFENMKHFHPTLKTTIIIELLSLTIQYVDKSNHHLFSEVISLISEHYLWNSKLCSLCITLCRCKSSLTLPFLVNIFNACKSLGIILENNAIHVLLDVFVQEDCDIALLINFWEYAQIDCKKILDLSFVNYIIHFCGTNDVSGELASQVIKLIRMMETRYLHYHSLDYFLNKLEEQQQNDIMTSGSNLDEQSRINQKLHQQHDMIPKQKIISMVESSSWHELSSVFKKSVLEQNMDVLKSIHLALYLQTSHFVECYQKFAGAVNDGSETVYEMHFLGQIGTVLMLEAYAKKDYVPAYLMLHSMHSINIQFYELQIGTCKSGHLSTSCFENSTSACEVDRCSVVFAAVDVCLEVEKQNSAFTVINDFDWTKSSTDEDKNISKDSIIKKANILLRLAVKAFSKKFYEIALELMKILIPIIQKDLLLSDIKDMATELTKVYNRSLEFLINNGELASALQYYSLSTDQKLNFLEVKDHILRGLVVSHAVAGLTDTAWSYFVHSVYRKVYSIPIGAMNSLCIESSWTQVEIQFAIEFFLKEIFPTMLCKPIQILFEDWFSIRILFKNSEAVTSLECLSVTSTTVEAALERTICVLLSKMKPPLDIESFENRPHNVIDIKPDSLYKRFCIWKKKNPTQQLTNNNLGEVFTFEIPTSFKFGELNQQPFFLEKQDRLSIKFNISSAIEDARETEAESSGETVTAVLKEQNKSNIPQSSSNEVLNTRFHSSTKNSELLNSLHKTKKRRRMEQKNVLEHPKKKIIRLQRKIFMPSTPRLQSNSHVKRKASLSNKRQHSATSNCLPNSSNVSHLRTLPKFVNSASNVPNAINNVNKTEENSGENLDTLLKEQKIPNVAQNFSKELVNTQSHSSAKKFELLNGLPTTKQGRRMQQNNILELPENNIKFQRPFFMPSTPKLQNNPHVKRKSSLNSNMRQDNETLNCMSNSSDVAAVSRPLPRFVTSPLNNSDSRFGEHITCKIDSRKDSSDSCYYSECSPMTSCGTPESWSSLTFKDEKREISESGVPLFFNEGTPPCSPEIFKKIENFLKAKLGASNNHTLVSKAKNLARTFISDNNITSSLDRRSMKLLVDYAKAQVR